MKIVRYALFLDRFEVQAQIGIHDFERNGRQRVAISIEIEIDPGLVPACDDIAVAPDYDWIREQVRSLVDDRRFDLQETLAKAIVDIVAERSEVTRVKVETAKLDVYPDARSVGCRLEAVKQ